MAVGTTSLQLVRPFIPEPFVTGAVALLGIISAVWLKIKEARVTDILSKVKLGAVITAGTVDALVKADPAMWAMFKKQQEKSSAGTGAIMPDKLVIETL